MTAKKKAVAPPEIIPDAEPDTAAQDALKAEAQETERTIEYDGVTYTIDPDSYDDLELIEALADFDETANRLVIPRIVERLIGAKEYAAFKARYRNPKTGRVPFTPVRDLFYAIDSNLGE